MKIYTKTIILCTSIALATTSNAALLAWQNEVTTGTSASTTLFTTVSTPQTFDVGALTGPMSFEFIVNADISTAPTSALLGNRTNGVATGADQAIKFEQWNNTGNYGLTRFGIADLDAGAGPTSNVDLHIAVTTDGTDTFFYQNGALVGTLNGTALNIAGTTGLGGVDDGGSFFDNLDGDILGFASYNSELSAVEITTHAAAFAAPVPEPSSALLAGLASLTLLRRKRLVANS